MSVLLTIVSLGPIFDAYDVKYLVIPGNIGIVISMMLIGLCKGQYILPFQLNSHIILTLNLRILPILPLLRPPRRRLSLPALQSRHRHHRPLL